MSTATPQAAAGHALRLPRLRLLKLDIAVRWRRPHVIPGPVIANVLRGALGLTLRKLVCPPDWFHEPCAPCSLYQGCAYGRIFAPTPPPDAAQLSRQADLPRPFVIEPPGLRPDVPVTPEGITFGLMLFGTAIERLPFVVTALARLGEEGMGRDRVPFAIESVTAVHPAENEPLFAAGSSQMRLPQRLITRDDLTALPWAREPGGTAAGSAAERVAERMGLRAPLAPPPSRPGRPRIKLHFLTPTVLKTGSSVEQGGRRVPASQVRERPPFGVVARRLRDRLSALSAFFGEPWQTDFAELGRQADAVELVHSQTTWLDRRRRSTRTGQAHELSGFVGQATYEFPNEAALETFKPLLAAGQYLHIGKYAPWGNGKVAAVVRKGQT